MKNEPANIEIFLVDDHQVLREGLKAMLNAHPHLRVVGEAKNGNEALPKILYLQPQIVVMDLSMPELNGAQATQQLKPLCPAVKILILTQHDDPAYLRQALEAGASGYVLKESAAETLIGAVQSVAAGGTYLDPEIACTLVNNYLGRELPKEPLPLRNLTERETEVLKLMAWGHTNQEIAVKLQLSVKTVETHKKHVMGKLALRTRAELVRYAVGKGWMQN
jgi:two-component system response regulator NreC